jgi:hypothetical protein
MVVGRGLDRSPPRKIVKLKVDLTKLNNVITPRKLVTLKVDPGKLSELLLGLNNKGMFKQCSICYSYLRCPTF